MALSIRVVHALAAVLLCRAVSAAPALAQSYSARPIRLVVPFPPGGPADILARTLGQHLADRWGQQVVIDNRAGAGGNIGSDSVAKAPPDGYTLLLGFVGTHAINALAKVKMQHVPYKGAVPALQDLLGGRISMIFSSMPQEFGAFIVSETEKWAKVVKFSGARVDWFISKDAPHVQSVQAARAHQARSLHLHARQVPQQGPHEMVGSEPAARRGRVLPRRPRV